jgi:hypothetical protein
MNFVDFSIEDSNTEAIEDFQAGKIGTTVQVVINGGLLDGQLPDGQHASNAASHPVDP